MIYISIPGDPIPWKRAGHNFKTGHTYDRQPKERAFFQNIMRSQFLRQKDELITDPIRLVIEFVFSPPKSWTKKQQYDAIHEKKPVTKRPDLDNCLKFVKDCLTGVVIADDKLVTRLACEKFYGKKPQTLIQIEILGSTDE